MRSFFEVPTRDFKILIAECSDRMLIAKHSEEYLVTAMTAYYTAFMAIFDFFAHAIFAAVIHV